MNEIGIGIGIDSVGGASKPNGNPSALTLTILSNTSIKCDWTNGATNQDGTYIYISTDNITFINSATALGVLTTKTLIELTATAYYVKAAHYKGGSISQYSNTVYVNTLAIYDTNTVAWYDSQLLSTITKDGSNLVSRWNDRLLSGNDLLQAAGTNQPLWSVNGILFDGVDNFMKTSSFVYNQPEYIYIVLTQKAWTLNDVIVDGNLDNTGRIRQRAASPNIRISAGTESADIVVGAINTVSILRVLFNGTMSKVIVGETATTGINVGYANMGGISIGSVGVSAFGNIEVKEAIFRKVADSASYESAIYNYLKTKYGL